MLKRNSWPYLFDLNPWRRMIANLNGSDLSVCVLFQEKQEVYEKWRLWYQIYSDIFWYVLHCSDILYIYTIYTHYICYIYIYYDIFWHVFDLMVFGILVGWTGGTSLARSDHIIGEVLTRTVGHMWHQMAQSNLKTSSFQTTPPPPHNLYTTPLIFESSSCKLDVLESFLIFLCVSVYGFLNWSVEDGHVLNSQSNAPINHLVIWDETWHSQCHPIGPDANDSGPIPVTDVTTSFCNFNDFRATKELTVWVWRSMEE